MASKILEKLEERGQYYLKRKDFRMHKIQNMIAILKEIDKSPGIKIDKLLSICSVNEPFLNKKTGLRYLEDMEMADQIFYNKKTREVKLCG